MRARPALGSWYGPAQHGRTHVGLKRRPARTSRALRAGPQPGRAQQSDGAPQVAPGWTAGLLSFPRYQTGCLQLLTHGCTQPSTPGDAPGPSQTLSSSRVLVGAKRASAGGSPRRAKGSWLARLRALLAEAQGRAAYSYFNWRWAPPWGVVCRLSQHLAAPGSKSGACLRPLRSPDSLPCPFAGSSALSCSWTRTHLALNQPSCPGPHAHTSSRCRALQQRGGWWTAIPQADQDDSLQGCSQHAGGTRGVICSPHAPPEARHSTWTRLAAGVSSRAAAAEAAVAAQPGHLVGSPAAHGPQWPPRPRAGPDQALPSSTAAMTSPSAAPSTRCPLPRLSVHQAGRDAMTPAPRAVQETDDEQMHAQRPAAAQHGPCGCLPTHLPAPARRCAAERAHAAPRPCMPGGLQPNTLVQQPDSRGPVRLPSSCSGTGGGQPPRRVGGPGDACCAQRLLGQVSPLDVTS